MQLPRSSGVFLLQIISKLNVMDGEKKKKCTQLTYRGNDKIPCLAVGYTVPDW
jgi:hypothetical protein